jgi:Mg-chelatase subunit ChlD
MYNRQRGSSVPIVMMVTMVLSAFAIGGSALARMVIAKQDAQQVADAAAFGTIDAVRIGGRNGGQPGPLNAARGNSRVTSVVQNQLSDQNANRRIVSNATASTTVDDLPIWLFGTKSFEVKAQATARVSQERRLSGNSLKPDVVLVLDFSGSMEGERIRVLKESMQQTLNDQTLDMNFAGVLFSDDVISSVDLNTASGRDDLITMITDNAANGGTNTGSAYTKAAQLLDQTPRPDGYPRYVVLVSDGEPNDPGAAVAAAEGLWNNQKATLMALDLSGARSAFMLGVSGRPDKKGDPSYYFNVSNTDLFQSAIAEIISTVLCPITPLDASANRPGEEQTVTAFLQRAQREIKLQKVSDLFAARNDLAYTYDPSARQIRFSRAACNLVHAGQQVVVRYRLPRLID